MNARTVTQDGRIVEIPPLYEAHMTPAQWFAARQVVLQDYGFELGALEGSACTAVRPMHDCVACWGFHAGCCGACCDPCDSAVEINELRCNPARRRL